MSPTTWIIIAVITLIIGGGLAGWGGFEKYSKKSTNTLYMYLFIFGLVIAIIGLGLLFYGLYRYSKR